MQYQWGKKVFLKEPVSFMYTKYTHHLFYSSTVQRYFYYALNNKFNWQENQLLGNSAGIMQKVLLHKDTQLLLSFLHCEMINTSTSRVTVQIITDL